MSERSGSGTLLCVGDLNLDLLIRPSAPIAEGSDTSGSVRLFGGGSAANVAAGAARAGIDARFVGAVGDDLLGSFLVAELAGHGVDVRPIVRPGAPSRSIAVLVGPDGDRSMVSDVSTEVAAAVGDFDPSWFDGVTWLHLTAYTWFAPHSIGVFEQLRAEAANRGIVVSIDPSSAEMLGERTTPQAACSEFAGAALMVPSHDEASFLAGIADPVAAATRLLDVAESVAVTVGADGAVIASREWGDVRRIAAPAVDVVSTLGCGDAFAGAIIAALMRGEPLDAAALAGVRAGSETAARPAAR